MSRGRGIRSRVARRNLRAHQSSFEKVSRPRDIELAPRTGARAVFAGAFTTAEFLPLIYASLARLFRFESLRFFLDIFIFGGEGLECVGYLGVCS